MRYVLSLTVILAIAFFAEAQNSVPEINNLSVSFDDNAKQITVHFDLADYESDNMEILVSLSDDYGGTFLADILNLQGDVGYPVSPGTNKQVTLNYDQSAQPVPGWMVKITADDHQPVDIQQLVDQVDSNLLREDLTFITGIRHYQTDTVHLEAVKDYIEHDFRKNGLITYRQNFEHNGYHSANIISYNAGVKDERVLYIVDAHFDSVNNSPGADDNGSGIAGVLEAARILSRYKFEHTIKFIGFDFEESSPTFGLTGSITYVSEGIKSYEQLDGVFNFEMIGYYTEKPNSQQVPTGFNLLFPTEYSQLSADSFRGNFLVNVAVYPSDPLKDEFSSAAAQYVPNLKVISVSIPDTLLPFTADFWRSDHASFWGSGYKAIMLTDGANFRNHNYHTSHDTLGSINFTFMTNIVKATIGAVATLAKPVHASSEVAYLIDTGISDFQDQCNWRLYQSDHAITFYPDKDCSSKVWNISLFDTQGKLVFQKKSVSERLMIESFRLPSGLYFFSATNGKRVESLPFVVK